MGSTGAMTDIPQDSDAQQPLPPEGTNSQAAPARGSLPSLSEREQLGFGMIQRPPPQIGQQFPTQLSQTSMPVSSTATYPAQGQLGSANAATIGQRPPVQYSLYQARESPTGASVVPGVPVSAARTNVSAATPSNGQRGYLGSGPLSAPVQGIPFQIRPQGNAGVLPHGVPQTSTPTPGPAGMPVRPAAPNTQIANGTAMAAQAGLQGYRAAPSYLSLRPTPPMMSSQAYLQQANAQLQSLHAARGTQAGAQLNYAAQPQSAQSRPQMSGYQVPGAPLAVPNGAPPGSNAPGSYRPVNVPSPQMALVGPGGQQMRPPLPLQPQIRGLDGRFRPLANIRGGRPLLGSVTIPAIRRPGAPQVSWLGANGTIRPQTTSLVISDRKLKTADAAGGSESLYVLLRRWVQNDTALSPEFPVKLVSDSEPFLQDATAGETDEEIDERPPQVQALTELVPAWEDVMDTNLAHWKDVRAYHVNKRQRVLEKHRLHLISLIPDSSGGTETPSLVPQATPPPSILQGHTDHQNELFSQPL